MYTIKLTHWRTGQTALQLTANTKGEFCLATNDPLQAKTLSQARKLFKETRFDRLLGTLTDHPFIEGPRKGCYTIQ